MTILLFDTSTEILIACLAEVQNGKISRLEKRETKTGLNHTGFLLPAVQELMQSSSFHLQKPDAVACALGPGSFTGLRIGLSTAKGLAEGWGIPMVGVDSLKAMAQTFLAHEGDGALALPTIDARKNKFYVALYQKEMNWAKELVPVCDLSPPDIQVLLQNHPGVKICGYQAPLLWEKLETKPSFRPEINMVSWVEALVIQAYDHFLQNLFLPPEAGPFYLRLSEAEENLMKKGLKADPTAGSLLK